MRTRRMAIVMCDNKRDNKELVQGLNRGLRGNGLAEADKCYRFKTVSDFDTKKIENPELVVLDAGAEAFKDPEKLSTLIADIRSGHFVSKGIPADIPILTLNSGMESLGGYIDMQSPYLDMPGVVQPMKPPLAEPVYQNLVWNVGQNEKIKGSIHHAPVDHEHLLAAQYGISRDNIQSVYRMPAAGAQVPVFTRDTQALKMISDKKNVEVGVSKLDPKAYDFILGTTLKADIASAMQFGREKGTGEAVAGHHAGVALAPPGGRSDFTVKK